MRNKLKSKRVLYNLTQGEVATMLGINRKSYNKKENGKSQFSLEEISKLRIILKLTVEEVCDIFMTAQFRGEISEVTI